MPRPHTVRAAVACAATGALSAIALLAAGGPSHAAVARAALEGARPGTGEVAIGRRRLNVVAGRRALVSGRIAGAAAGRAVALQRRAGAGWRAIHPDRTAPGGAVALPLPPAPPSPSASTRAGRAAPSSACAGRPRAGTSAG